MKLLLATLAIFPALLPAQDVRPMPRASITPSLVRLAPGAGQRFKAVLSATRLMAARPAAHVDWAVNEIPGGNATIGTIDADGLYRAPAKAPVPHEINIRGTVDGGENKYAWATVLMGDPNPAYKVVGKWSEPGVSPGRLRKPHGIGFDAKGNLLIADQKADRVFRYTVDGKFLGEIGSGPGSDAGQFMEPRFATSDQDGNIYVTDVKGDRPRLQVFDPDGKLLRIFAEKGTGPGQILRGHGIAFDPQHRMFVTDVDNMRVSVFEPTGKFLFHWGKDGPNHGDFNAPHGLFVDANGDVFVNGYYGPTQKFTGAGRFLTTFSAGDPPDGPVYFHSLSGDRHGNIYVMVRTKEGYGGAVESQAGKKTSISKFNNNGDYVCSISMSVREHIETWSAIAPDGTVYSLFTTKNDSGVEILREQ
ncbi:MAG: NHL repeat-containing protein [Acidobacteria bacterium]|nr:NHL repeat-containing protein [Acidobacteriota bacterium]